MYKVCDMERRDFRGGGRAYGIDRLCLGDPRDFGGRGLGSEGRRDLDVRGKGSISSVATRVNEDGFGGKACGEESPTIGPGVGRLS